MKQWACSFLIESSSNLEWKWPLEAICSNLLLNTGLTPKFFRGLFNWVLKIPKGRNPATSLGYLLYSVLSHSCCNAFCLYPFIFLAANFSSGLIAVLLWVWFHPLHNSPLGSCKQQLIRQSDFSGFESVAWPKRSVTASQHVEHNMTGK